MGIGNPQGFACVATAVRWRQLALRTGRAVAGKPGGDRRSAKTDAHADFLLGLVAERGDIMLAETQVAMAERGSPVGIGTLWRFFDRRGITRKKGSPELVEGTGHAIEQDRPDVLSRRRSWFEEQIENDRKPL